jgi:hypothetical protein
VVTSDQAIAPSYRSEPLRTGIVEWAPGDELVGLIADEVAHLGHDVTKLPPSGPLPSGLEVLLVFGPFGTIAPLMAQLKAQPSARRPTLVWWLTEQLWHPALPHWIARGAAELRSGAERLVARAGSNADPSRWQWLTWRALRFRYYGDLLWLQRHGLLSVLAVPSQWLGEFLRGRGFEVTTVFIGAHPSFAAASSPERDIPVLWLGTHGSPRRRRCLQRITEELARRGVEVMLIDGVRHPPVHGAERAHLLGRSKIVLNLMRRPRDCNLLRFILSAPNRTLMISEPMLPHYPVHDGIHFVAAPLDGMADAVCRYLKDEPARNRITEQAHRLVTTDLTLARAIARIMRQAAQVRAAAAT